MNGTNFIRGIKKPSVENQTTGTVSLGLLCMGLMYSLIVFHVYSIDVAFGQTKVTQITSNNSSGNVPETSSITLNQFTVPAESSSGIVGKGSINSVISVPGGKWLATGNWSMTLNGNLTSFQIGTTWYNSSGTNSHTHELTNFIPTDLEQVISLDSLDNNILEGISDIGTNGQISWRQVPTTISFNAGKIINVSLDDNKTNGHFAAQPLMGIVNSVVRCSDAPTPNMEVLPPCSATTFAEDDLNHPNTTTLYAPSEVLPPPEGGLGTEQELPYEDSTATQQGLPSGEGLLPEDEPLLPEDEPVNTPETNVTTVECKELTVSNVSASGFETDPSDYHPSSDAIDDDSATWWSNKGDDSWLQLDLGDGKNICNVSIEWNKGDTRKYGFEVEVSYDGDDFVKVFEGTNKGDSLDPETYGLDGVTGRYLKISATNTGTDDGWVSIKEINLTGSPTT